MNPGLEKVPPLPFCYLRYAFSFVLLGLFTHSSAQDNVRCKTLTIDLQGVTLDSLLIDPSSIRLSSEIPFVFDKTSRQIKAQNASDEGNEVEVCYRVLSPVLLTPYFQRDIRSYEWRDPDETLGFNFNQQLPVPENRLFNTPNLNKSGSITRGITVGNRQNVFVNSSLNLALDGQLSDNLNVSALITDQNIPYQPEGNTQQLRDFDNVYIKLYNDQFDLTLGDVVLTNPVGDSYFLKYYKNVQGGTVSYKGELKGGWRSTSRLGASVAKGQFASISIDPIEGVQGPYRLRGPEGQRFIIVLANSERVFIDGKQLQRGFEKDYVIDYNLGEIIFNTNIVVTRFTRIRVDFEFLEQSYSRSNLAISQTLQNKQHKAYFSFYRERDNPNNVGAIELDQNGRFALSQLSDQETGAFVSAVDSIGFVEERILYARRDTTVNGIAYEFFEFSNDPEEAVFNLRFTELGTGQGNYVLTTSTANGRVYQWVAPVNGEPQGNFEPVVQISAPDQRQLFVAGSQSDFGKIRVNQEVGVSNRDLNLLSVIDDGDNDGVSWKGDVHFDSVFAVGNYFGSLHTSFEFNQRDFQAIDRFRYIEFDRDWVYRQDTVRNHQYITGLGLSLKNTNQKQLSYSFENRVNGDFKGWRQMLELKEKLGPVLISGDYFFLENEQDVSEADWLRTDSDVKLMNRFLVPGYNFRTDQNTIKAIGTDSVLRTNMYFEENTFYLQNPDSAKLTYKISYAKRYDQLPVEGKLVDFTESDNYGAILAANPGSQQYQVDFNFRRVQDKINDENIEQVQGRTVAINSFFDSHVYSNLSLAISSGRELRREFIYIPVNAGEGTHTWRDENGDGIQDLNEFYEAINPDEKTFIKLFVPTDEYIAAFRNQYLHNIDISMPRSWREASGFLKTLGKLSYQINLNLDNKTSNADLNKRINPFAAFGDDDQIISRRNNTRYSVFFNRANPGFGLEFSYNDRERRQLLSNGFERTDEQFFSQSTRIGLLETYNLTTTINTGSIVNQSDFLESRNFDVRRREVNPRLTWQPGTAFRLTGGYKLSRSENMGSEGNQENANTNEWTAEMTYSRVSKGNLTSRFTFSDIKFEGDENSFLGYTLLNALRPGENYQINVNWQQRLVNGLQMTMQYFGRKSGGDAFVHTGSFQLTAFF